MTTAQCSAYVDEQHRYLRSVTANRILVDHVDTPSSHRLYYLIRENAYFSYDHAHGFAYFGRCRGDADAKARWRGWLRSQGVIV